MLMELDKHTVRQKKWRKLSREEDKISEIQRNIPSVPIKPYQRGWIIYYDLREDCKRRADADVLMAILRMTSHEYETRKVKHIKRIRGLGTRVLEFLSAILGEGEHYMYHDVGPCKKGISKEKFNQLSPTIAKHFYLQEKESRVRKKGMYYASLYHWMIVVKTKPNMITHMRGKDTALETREHELNTLLYDNMQYTGCVPEGWCSGGNWKKYNAGAIRSYYRDQISKYKAGVIEDIPLTPLKDIPPTW